MIYKFKPGSRVSGVSAQVAGEVIESIRERDGHVETEIVIKEASSKSSPIHGAFQWDNKKAGHQFRLIQARSMIKALIVVLDNSCEPAFVHVQAGKTNYYQLAEIAVGNPQEWELVRNTALYRMQTAVETLDVLDRVAARCKPKVSTRARAAKTALQRAHQQLANA